MNIKQIEKDMRSGTLTPHQMAEYHVYLAGIYSQYAGHLEEILLKKTDVWMKLREDQKSDASTDRAWDATEDGKRELALRLRLKKIEKMIASLKTGMRIAENEARNIM